MCGPESFVYNSVSLFFSVPLPPAGELNVRDITHSTMRLIWDAAPGPVRKYIVTYTPEDGDAKEVCVFRGLV